MCRHGQTGPDNPRLRAARPGQIDAAPAGISFRPSILLRTSRQSKRAQCVSAISKRVRRPQAPRRGTSTGSGRRLKGQFAELIAGQALTERHRAASGMSAALKTGAAMRSLVRNCGVLPLIDSDLAFTVRK